MTSPVLYNVKDQVATITLNRPEVLNAFNEETIALLTSTFQHAGQDNSVRAVVIRGNGKSFCAGGDINWMRKMADYSHEENIEDAKALANLFRTLDTLPKPTIALVHRHAFGGGVGLTACCDVAIAAEDAVFCLSEVRIGILPSVISPYVINAIGIRHARRFFLTAERIDAETAQRIGLVHEVTPVEALDTVCAQVLEEIFKGGPRAQSRSKELLAYVANTPLDDTVIQRTIEEIANERASEEGKAGLSAFLNKTPPPWQ